MIPMKGAMVLPALWFSAYSSLSRPREPTDGSGALLKAVASSGAAGSSQTQATPCGDCYMPDGSVFGMKSHNTSDSCLLTVRANEYHIRVQLTAVQKSDNTNPALKHHELGHAKKLCLG